MSQLIQKNQKTRWAALARTVVVAAIATTCLVDRSTASESIAKAPAPAPQAWLLSTRQAPRTGNLESAGQFIRAWRHGDDRRWAPAPADELIEQSDPAVPTVVFIHGNLTDLNGAVCDGWPVYRYLQRSAGGRPFRFVIWAWPADRTRGGLRNDARVKARYSDAQSYYLADWLSQLAPEGPVNLIGHSFGARIVAGALHLLGGGQIAGRTLSHETDRQHGPLRAVLVAAALDADWLSPSRRNGLALSQVDRLLLTKNSRDPVLKWYRLMNGHGGPMAIGSTGPVWCGQPKPHRDKIEVFQIANSVGRAHAWTKHLASASLRQQFLRFTFPEPATSFEP